MSELTDKEKETLARRFPEKSDKDKLEDINFQESEKAINDSDYFNKLSKENLSNCEVYGPISDEAKRFFGPDGLNALVRFIEASMHDISNAKSILTGNRDDIRTNLDWIYRDNTPNLDIRNDAKSGIFWTLEPYYRKAEEEVNE